MYPYYMIGKLINRSIHVSSGLRTLTAKHNLRELLSCYAKEI